MTKTQGNLISRRTIIMSGVGLATVTLAAPALIGRARAAGTVAVRTLGGAYEDAARESYFKPFTEETGIEVQAVPANMAKLLAMHKANAAEIDVLDIGLSGVIQLQKEGGLAAIDYNGWKTTKKEDLDDRAIGEFSVGHTYYSTIIGFNTDVFAADKGPKNWVDFWDVDRFPGPRSLADIASGVVDLEQALIADGVPLDQIYPIDLPRALNSLARIRPHVRKFWDTGALSAQMISDQEAVMGSVWNSRLQAAIDKGAPLAGAWSGGMLNQQCWSIAKGSRNQAEAQRFVEFVMQPERLAGICKAIPVGPANKRTFEFLTPDRIDIMPSNPKYAAETFQRDEQWWAENRQLVTDTWSKWLLENK